ncbi:polysaccharide deacetylase family protein [Compostibacter hankyongensis]|uniref:NodB homology domain-containing protein n=1 Tax=Compostibacter hankyongensis TaxID=1007089 RepID=A0ABP8FNQ4_9BACT
MIYSHLLRHILPLLFLIILFGACSERDEITGRTEITRWPDGKRGAVSITYDDGNRNQFRYALPVMERLHIPATFYIITGPIAGSAYPGKFIGRPVRNIILESATVPTGNENYFERISAARYLGYKGALAYYDRSAGLFERDKKEAAYRVMDTLYAAIRSRRLKPGTEYSMEISDEKGLSWDSLRAYAARGYEFSSHTVTHTHLAVLDTANIAYELGKSREDIRNHLGRRHTFDAEIPFGIEHPRAMKYALPFYPALRNRMTDPYLKEINRGYKDPPGISDREYVQWQRGPLTATPYTLMQSWVDTVLAHDNIWLVLVFHGIDGLGWEPLTHHTLEAYFRYIRRSEDSLWIATFGDVARYMRERMNTGVLSRLQEDGIVLTLRHSPDTAVYDVPLTLKTYVPESWKHARVIQGGRHITVKVQKDETGNYVLYPVRPGRTPIRLIRQQPSPGKS